MRVLTQAERAAVRARLGRLSRAPELRLFTQLIEWDACRLARELCEELLSLEPRLGLTVHDFQSERTVARRSGVTGIPALVPVADGGPRVRFLGVPLGHEFPVLLEDLVDVGTGTSRLSPPTLAELREVHRPLHIRVFASADCPYSPRTVRLAHQLALAHPLVQAEMVSVVEFPEVADRFGVESLPTVVVNDGVVQFEGALSEPEFCAQVFRALGPRSMRRVGRRSGSGETVRTAAPSGSETAGPSLPAGWDRSDRPPAGARVGRTRAGVRSPA